MSENEPKTLPEDEIQIAWLDGDFERFGVAAVDSTVFRDKAKANHAIVHLSKNVFDECQVVLITPHSKLPYLAYGSEDAKAALKEVKTTSLDWKKYRLP